jgi:hypothetical protein
MGRGTLLRTPLLTMGTIAAAGVRCEWTLDLEPVGDRTVADGQRVELHVAVEPPAGPVGEPAEAAFDVLPADASGRVSGPALARLTPAAVERPLAEGEDVAAARSAFVAEHPDDLTSHLLVVREPARTHLLTWWDVAPGAAGALHFAAEVAGLPSARTERALRRSRAAPEAGTIVLELHHEEGPPMAGAELEAAFAGGVRTRATTGPDGRVSIALPPGAEPVFRVFLLSYAEGTAPPPGPGPGPGPAPGPGPGPRREPEPVDTRPEVVAAFAFDSAFPAPIVHANLLRVRRKATESPQAELIVFGHTDKVGSVDYNVALSDRRAQAVLALLIDDRDMFEGVAAEEGWDTRVHQSMLRGIGCNPGGIDGAEGPMTRTATLNFQREYNRGVYHERAIVDRERPVLAEDGGLGPATRAAVRDAYVAVAPHVQRERFADPPYDGCGKAHHVSDRDGENRRAVVAFLPEGTDLTRGAPCERYAEVVGETPQDRRGPHFADHQWLLEENGALHLSSATAVADGTAALIRVLRCEGPVPMPPPDSSGGGSPPALGPELARVPARIQGGICHGRWTSPEPWVLDPDRWMVDHDVQIHILDEADHAEPAPGTPASGAGLLAATGSHPPVYVAEAGEYWGVAGPPGQRLNRVRLAPGEAGDEQEGLAVVTAGPLVAFNATGGRLDAGEAVDVTRLAVADHDLADAGTAPSQPPPRPAPPRTPAPATATVHVQDEAGAPLAGVRLVLIAPGGPHAGRDVLTDARGDVAVTPAAGGDHEVTALEVELFPADGAAGAVPAALVEGSAPDPGAHHRVPPAATTVLVARRAHVVLCPGCGRPYRVVRPPAVAGAADVTCPADGWNLTEIQTAAIAEPGSFLGVPLQSPAATPNALRLRGSATAPTAHGTAAVLRDESRFAIAGGGDYTLWGRPPTGPAKLARITGRATWSASAPVIAPGRNYDWHEAAVGAAPPYTFAVPSPETGPLADSLFWITVHHTTDSEPLVMRALQTKHQTEGSESGGVAADVGYHFAIDATGTVFEGRPLAIEGSHVELFNGGNVGIALQGDFESRAANLGRPDTPSPAQLVALRNLVDVLAARFTIRDVDGHNPRKLASTGRGTDCPGDNLEGFVASPLHSSYPGPP